MNDFIKFLDKYSITANDFVDMYKESINSRCLHDAKIVAEGLSFFKKSKSKSIPKQVIDHPEMIKQYLELWPAIILPSGKPARVSESVIITCLIWFFNEYQFSWATVLTATQEYVFAQEAVHYKMCRTSQYFIVKTNGGIKESLLADYCVLVESGGHIKENPFKDKVV